MIIAVDTDWFYSVQLSDDVQTLSVVLTGDTTKRLSFTTPAADLLRQDVIAAVDQVYQHTKLIESGPGTDLEKMRRVMAQPFPSPETWRIAVRPGAPFSLVNFTCPSYEGAGDKQGRIYVSLGKQSSAQAHRGWGLVHIWRRHFPDSSYEDIMDSLHHTFQSLAADIAQDAIRYAMVFLDKGSRRHGDNTASTRFAIFDARKTVTLLDWQVDQFNVITHFPSTSQYYRDKVAKGEWAVCLKRKS